MHIDGERQRVLMIAEMRDNTGIPMNVNLCPDLLPLALSVLHKPTGSLHKKTAVSLFSSNKNQPALKSGDDRNPGPEDKKNASEVPQIAWRTPGSSTFFLFFDRFVFPL
jgi:hypothetical protein